MLMQAHPAYQSTISFAANTQREPIESVLSANITGCKAYIACWFLFSSTQSSRAISQGRAAKLSQQKLIMIKD